MIDVAADAAWPAESDLRNKRDVFSRTRMQKPFLTEANKKNAKSKTPIMKKILLTLISTLTVAANSYAVLVFNDTFSYPDGGVVANSAGIWVNSSGTAGSMLASNQQLVVSTSRTEDIAASLGSTYMTNGSTPALYASFTLRCLGLPTSAGAYFAHFTGPNTFGPLTGHRARVWAGITNIATGTQAAPGSFLLSLLNTTNNPIAGAQWPNELATNVTYTIVVKYEIATMVSTMWIDPVSESDPSITGTDFPSDLLDAANGLVNITSYGYRQATGEGTQWIDNLRVGTEFANVAGPNTSPLISAIPSQSTPANTTAGPIGFTVQDAETAPATDLTVTAGSANLNLVPEASIALATIPGTGGTNRTVTITPASGQQGQTTITLTVNDGTNSSPTSFQLTVGAPTISPIPNQTTTTDTPTAAIPFTVNDAEGDPLVLSSNSSNPTLISDANIVIAGGGANRTVTLTPEPGQQGLTTITLSVTDGFITNSQKFAVTVSPSLGVIFSDDFSYPDGSLVGNGTWSTSSGTPGQMLVTNGTVQISQSLGEDMNSGSGFAGGSPFAPASGVVLYAGFTINATQLPTSAGNYFAHFKDSSTGFRARIFTSRANAAPGNFRIGIANSAGAVSGEVATDLATNTTYQIVSRYNVGTGESVVWVNPASAASPGAPATDTPSTITVAQYGLRQDSSMGTLYLDNLKIGTSMADVVTILTPLAPALTNSVVNGELVLSWGNPQFALQSAPTLTGTFTTIPGATSPYTNSLSGSEAYFRLKY